MVTHSESVTSFSTYFDWKVVGQQLLIRVHLAKSSYTAQEMASKNTKQVKEKHQAILNDLLREEPNRYCADCMAKGKKQTRPFLRLTSSPPQEGEMQYFGMKGSLLLVISCKAKVYCTFLGI